jgi:hypothetical protein
MSECNTVWRSAGILIRLLREGDLFYALAPAVWLLGCSYCFSQRVASFLRFSGLCPVLLSAVDVAEIDVVHT